MGAGVMIDPLLGHEVMVVSSVLVVVKVAGIDHDFVFRSESAAEEFVEEYVTAGRVCGMEHRRVSASVDLTFLSAVVEQQGEAA